jgi:SAM-dependent methyltransferase
MLTTLLENKVKGGRWHALIDKEGGCYEDYFPHAEFFTLDLTPAQHPRHIVADLMDLSNVNQKFDLILMMSVLEHVEKPFLAAEKLRNLMTDDGYLYLTLPFFYPVHEGPHFGDFWRFTPTAIEQVFDYCDVVSQDRYPSVIRAVADRRNYWNEMDSSYTGFSVLMRNRRQVESNAA